MTDPENPLSRLPTPDPGTRLSVSDGSADFNSLPRVELPPLPKPPARRPRFLLIDDNPGFLAAQQALHATTALRLHADLLCECYDDGDYTALLARIEAHLATAPLDALVIDLNLGASGTRSGGIALLRRLREDQRRLTYVPCAIMTAFLDPDLPILAADADIDQFIVKIEANEGSHTVVMSLLPYRFITERPQWLAAAEERFWRDLSGTVARLIAAETGIQELCTQIGAQLAEHFQVGAIYVRQHDGAGKGTAAPLRLVGGHDGIGAAPDLLQRGDMPFLDAFLAGGMPADRIEALADRHLGSQARQHLRGLRVLMARMAVGAHPVGVVTLYRPVKENPFRQIDVVLASLLAQQLAAAIYRGEELKRLREHEERLRRQQSRLPDVMRQFVAAGDEKQIFALLQRTLHDAFAPRADGAVTTTIRALAPGTQNIPRQAEPSGEYGGVVPEIRLDMYFESTVARVTRDGTPELANDISRRKTRSFIFPSGRERAHLTVPLRTGEICLGAVSIESAKPDIFEEDDTKYAVGLCIPATEAVMRLRAQRFSIGMAKLLDSVTVDRGQTRGDLVAAAVRLLFDYTGFAELMYLLPADPAAPPESPWDLRGVYGQGGSPYGGDKLELWRRRSTVAWPTTFNYHSLLRGRNVSYTNNKALIGTDRDKRPDAAETMAQATLLIRYKSDAPPQAMLSLLFLHPLALSQRERDMLEVFAGVLARLLAEETHIDELRGALTLREQNARIGLAYQQMRHGLRAKIGLIRQYALLLVDTTGKEAEIAARIISATNRLAHDIARNRNIAKVPQPETVDLAAVWNQVCETLAVEQQQFGGDLLPGKFGVTHWITDRSFLEAILETLAENALRYGGPKVRVTVETRALPCGVAIDILDDGVGIPEKVRQKLFEAGTTTGTDTTGLGLFISREQASLLNGSIQLLSDYKSGAGFRLILPPATEDSAI